MEPQATSLVELAAVQALLGAPVFLGAAAFLGFYLRRSKGARLRRVLLSCGLLLLLALPLAVLIWGFWPGGTTLMVAGFINLPALVALLILTPLVLWNATRSRRRDV